MKKTIKSLAVLAILSTAAMFSSCKKNDLSPASVPSSDRIATVTIAPPSVEETKFITNDDGTALTILAWENGDEVTLIKTKEGCQWQQPYVSKFTCIDAKSGTFSGVLPEGVKEVDEFEYAMYNALYVLENSSENALLTSVTKVSTDIKDVILMGAKNNKGHYSMSIIGNILQITNNADEMDAYVSLKGSGPISISFNISTIDGKNSITYYSTETKSQTILTIPQGISYVLLPNNESNAFFGISKDGEEWTASASIVPFKQIGANGKLYTYTYNPPITPVLPDGVLSGEFSVSDTKTVHFSKGNLQATFEGGKYTWGFAANQYDYVGNAAGNTTIDSQSNGSVVDLFGWSTPNTDFGISNSNTISDYSGDFVDWGKNIGDGNTWRTLTKAEFEYLFETRNNAFNLYKNNVEVCGNTNCLVIAPDGFSGSIAASYEPSAWSAAEAAGLVCLPTAGSRTGSQIYDIGVQGIYWSSTSDDAEVSDFMCFSNECVDIGFKSRRYNGYSVRLVTE